MRKSLMVPVGLVSAAVLAVAGIAANAATASPSEPPQTATAPAATAPGAATANAIGRADAEQAALAAVPAGSVLETRLEARDGRLVWNVHLSTPDGVVEVKVDAQTGAAVLDDDDAAGLDDDQADDHGDGDHGDGRHGDGPGEGGSGRDGGHRDGHGSDDPAGHR